MKFIFTLTLFSCFTLFLQAQDLMVLKTSGKVIIGDTTQITTPGTYNLYVQNGVMTEKVKVALRSEDDWRDNSFKHTPTIQAVEEVIEQESHLYNMPSAKKLVAEGYELQEMDAQLLEQIEWLWQYTIQLSEDNKKLRKELDEIKKQLKDEK